MPDVFHLTGPARIEARSAGTDAPPSIAILAYNGGLMQVSRYGLLAIDLAGAALGEQVPIVVDHQTDLQGIIGHGVPSIAAGRLRVQGQLANTPAAQQVRELARSGMRFQASVGYEPTSQPRRIAPGDKVSVNGQVLTAERPWLLIEAGRLREVSVLAVGADSSTQVAIQGKAMEPEFSSWLEAQGFNPAELNEQQLQPLRAAWQLASGANGAGGSEPGTVAVTAERERIQAIMAACRTSGHHAEIERAAIEGGWTPDQARAAVLQTIREQRPSAAAIHVGGHPADATEVLAASLLIRARQENVALQAYGERAVSAARAMRRTNFLDYCEFALRAEGQTVPSNRPEMLRAALSTMALPNALGNAMNRSLMAHYLEAPASWRAFAAVKSANDFREQTGIRPSFVGELEPLPKGGEITHGSLDEAAFPWRVDTYAKMLTLDRQDIINDDLSFLDETAPLMAKAALRKLSDLVYGLLLSAVGTGFFSQGNGNLLTGEENSLSMESLAAAVAAFRTQRDANGNDVDIVPRVLLVPPALETMGRALLESTEIQLANDEAGPVGNALRSVATLAVESRLQNSEKFTEASDTGWYLLGGPVDAPLIVGYLMGQQAPTVEFFGLDAVPDQLAVSWRVYHDFGVALGDHRAALHANGTDT